MNHSERNTLLIRINKAKPPQEAKGKRRRNKPPNRTKTIRGRNRGGGLECLRNNVKRYVAVDRGGEGLGRRHDNQAA